ncbi:cytochrome c biogenesis CcdA family protein [Leucobacter luti]|uniref:Cytochrome c-type biogenesis protein n=1 Tax=Leucobacter luti TaxID=340320 RepID=A0A4R6RV33_9MICO|nr:cytochrome c biogenesis protein CcdA [Leucobacter luti]MCW2289649.1 cytochrome c-type biogenesis protein [Leucobacter luti]QYM77180.1 cytochrome c biogenesis protein CcdA [Leucobacter luti]TCK37820.1 cytochrome c-type biogenesis protein [Leucobacter luti]TDP90812.1 cytochrome c-type biogenesis protein [Leucobacter luti]
MNVQDLVADGQLLVASLIAVAAGLLSFLSPCVLPLVPGYLAYASASAGSAPGEPPARRRLVLGAILFVVGFSVVLVTFLAAAGTVGVWLIEWENLITRLLGVFVIVMGLVFIGLFSRMQTTKKLKMKPRLGIAGAPVLGAVFAIGWTPCMGPTLTVIMGLSLQQGSISRSIILAVAYCIGLGLPFVLAAFGFGWMTQTMTFFKRHIRAVNLIGGGLLILIGLLMVTGLWSKMMFALQAVIGGYVTPL